MQSVSETMGTEVTVGAPGGRWGFAGCGWGGREMAFQVDDWRWLQSRLCVMFYSCYPLNKPWRQLLVHGFEIEVQRGNISFSKFVSVKKRDFLIQVPSAWLIFFPPYYAASWHLFDKYLYRSSQCTEVLTCLQNFHLSITCILYSSQCPFPPI